MMARLVINEAGAAVVVIRTNTVFTEKVGGIVRIPKGKALPPPGLYRCTLSGNFARGLLIGSVRPVKVERELAELDARGDGRTRAWTGSPGVCGYQQRADASQSAAESRRGESRSIARAIRRHLGLPDRYATAGGTP